MAKVVCGYEKVIHTDTMSVSLVLVSQSTLESWLGGWKENSSLEVKPRFV